MSVVLLGTEELVLDAQAAGEAEQRLDGAAGALTLQTLNGP